MGEKEQQLELKDQLKNILEEARMVLPGIQALFGFQLIAVINEAFGKKLSEGEQRLHLAAIALTVFAIGMALTPAALHRVSEPHKVSQALVNRSSAFLNWGLKTLGLAIILDFYIVARVTLKDAPIALGLAAAAFVFLLVFWVIYPSMRREKNEKQKAPSMEPRSSNT